MVGELPVGCDVSLPASRVFVGREARLMGRRTKVEASAGESSDHDTAENLDRKKKNSQPTSSALIVDRFPRGSSIMTHHNLGVALGLILELLLVVVLETTDRRGEEATGCDAGRHCVCISLSCAVCEVAVGGCRELGLCGPRSIALPS